MLCRGVNVKDWTLRDVQAGPHYAERVPDDEPLFIVVPLKRVHGRLVAGRALQRHLGEKA